MRELGRGLAGEHEIESDPQRHVEAFCSMGFGNLRLTTAGATRFEFVATDLLDHHASAVIPTCHLTLGYLEGVVARATNRNALGTEMRCQSLGHDECKFVVMAQ
jgi:hypothetical protein